MLDDSGGFVLPQEQGFNHPDGLVVFLFNEGEGDSVKLIFNPTLGKTLCQIPLFQKFFDAPLENGLLIFRGDEVPADIVFVELSQCLLWILRQHCPLLAETHNGFAGSDQFLKQAFMKSILPVVVTKLADLVFQHALHSAQLCIQVRHRFEVQPPVQLFKKLGYTGMFSPKQFKAQVAGFWRPQQNTDVGELARLDIRHKPHDGVLARYPGHFWFQKLSLRKRCKCVRNESGSKSSFIVISEWPV